MDSEILKRKGMLMTVWAFNPSTQEAEDVPSVSEVNLTSIENYRRAGGRGEKKINLKAKRLKNVKTKPLTET